MGKLKKILVIVILAIVTLLLGVLIILFIKNNNITEDEFATQLNDMGIEIYSSYYYPNVTIDMTEEEIENTLSKYETIGLKFSLDEVEKIDEEYKKKIDKYINNNKNCSKEETMIVVYPQKPYTSDSFKIEVKISCESGS